MSKRSLNNYIGITRSVADNLVSSREDEKKTEQVTNPSDSVAENAPLQDAVDPATLHKLVDFFSDNAAWIKDLWTKKQYPYPLSITTAPDIMQNAQGQINPIFIGVAADWASDTVQSEYIGKCISNKGLNQTMPDYTIHLGDTYYSGTEAELNACFGPGNGNTGLWPRGSMGSFALAGNHEMFSSGQAYYNMITDKIKGFGIRYMGQYLGQNAPVFCLRTDHWCILGLDTGYDSLKHGLIPIHLHPDNTCLSLPDAVITWLNDVVKLKDEKRGIIVLTHHQYISAFNGEDEFTNPAKQLQGILPTGQEVIWIWGHEHRFSMYGKFQLDASHITAYGRCIGNGGMPDEHTSNRYVADDKALQRKLVLYDKRTADTFTLTDGTIDGDENVVTAPSLLDVGYNGYAVISLNNEQASIAYYASYMGDDTTNHTISTSIGEKGRDQNVFTETWAADNQTGKITCIGVTDYTIDDKDGDVLAYSKGKVSTDIFK